MSPQKYVVFILLISPAFPLYFRETRDVGKAVGKVIKGKYFGATGATSLVESRRKKKTRELLISLRSQK